MRFTPFTPHSPPPSHPDKKCHSKTNVSNYSASTGGFVFPDWTEVASYPTTSDSQTAQTLDPNVSPNYLRTRKAPVF